MALVDRRWMVLVGGLASAGCPEDATPEQDSTESTAGSSGTEDSGPPAGSSGIVLDESGGSSTDGGSSSDGADSSDSGSGSTGGIVDEGCPECLVLATGLESGRGIAVNDTHVFWSDQGAGTIHRIEKGGGEGMVLAKDAGVPYELALDDQHLYWTSNTDDGAVMRVPLDGGATELVAEATSPRTVDVAGGYVYWGGYDGVSGDVFRTTTDALGVPEEVGSFFGGAVADLVATQTSIFATTHTEESGVSFIEPPPDGPPVGSVFVMVPDAGGNPPESSLVGGMAQPWGLALSGGTLVWANGDGAVENAPNSIQSIQSTEIDGEPTQLAGGQSAPWGIAADANFAYWTDSDTVKAVALAGGVPEILATEQNAARYIVVDDAFVYWVTSDRVLQRPKP